MNEGVGWALRLASLGVALLGPWNTVDELVRGKWVRFHDTQIGEHTATLCLPAQTEAELPEQLAVLEDKLQRLEQAGAVAIGVDLADFGGPSELRMGGEVFPAHGEMLHSRLPPAVLGGRQWVDGAASFAALGLEALDVNASLPPGEPVLFMPVLLPFVHWDRPEEWAAVVEGRVVYVGACRLDRELTHYGRQPGPVAHSEIVETHLAGFQLWRALGGRICSSPWASAACPCSWLVADPGPPCRCPRASRWPRWARCSGWP